MVADSVTCWAISRIDAASSSVAAATVSTLAEACSEATATVADCSLAASAVLDIDCAAVCNWRAAAESDCASVWVLASKSPVSRSSACERGGACGVVLGARARGVDGGAPEHGERTRDRAHLVVPLGALDLDGEIAG